jgi:hypothetical protein
VLLSTIYVCFVLLMPKNAILAVFQLCLRQGNYMYHTAGVL